MKQVSHLGHIRVISAVLLSLAVLLSQTTAHAMLPSTVDVTISASNRAYTADQPILLNITYTNSGSAPVKLLKWETGLNGKVHEDFLSIYYQGAALVYIGPVFKRRPPTDSDFVTLPAGASVSASIDPSDGYAIADIGNYQVAYAAHQLHPSNLSKASTALFDFEILETRQLSSQIRTPNYASCSANRQSTATAALRSAESIAHRAANDLRVTPVNQRTSARRYSEWFGAYSASNWNRVQDHFNRISNATSNATIKFICDSPECKPNTFAFVFRNSPYDIYLCPVFWQVPRTGTDSQSGTIVHELSHFTVLGGTNAINDEVYGQPLARNLARTNPVGATKNAENHEYFAENTPFLSMPAPGTPTNPEPEPTPEPEPEPEPPTIAPILQLLLLAKATTGLQFWRSRL